MTYTCKKVWYLTEKEADTEVERIKRNTRSKRHDMLHSYFCQECEGYHVGHNWMLRITELCIGEMK